MGNKKNLGCVLTKSRMHAHKKSCAQLVKDEPRFNFPNILLILLPMLFHRFSLPLPVDAENVTIAIVRFYGVQVLMEMHSG